MNIAKTTAKSELCELICLMLMLGGMPGTPEGEQRMSKHFRSCDYCSTPDAFKDIGYSDLGHTPKQERLLTDAFGPIRWNASSDETVDA